MDTRAVCVLLTLLLCVILTSLCYGRVNPVVIIASKEDLPCSKERKTVQDNNALQTLPDEGDYSSLEDSEVRIKKKSSWFLGTCTATKSSGAWIREWIELQIAVGVDHVWVADDNPANSTDITTGVLKHYERLGYVTIIPPPDLNHTGCRQISGVDGRHNCAPVKHCFEHASPYVKWLLFADTDEFIFPHNGCSLKEHIKNHCNPDATQIFVRWERFGTSNIEQHPNGLMLENFLTSGGMCEKQFEGICGRMPYSNCPECRHSKVIYNTECAKVEHAGWIHWPVNTTDWKAKTLREYRIRDWVQSEGEHANWKSKQCEYTGMREAGVQCNKWVQEGGGSKRPKEYTPDCCTAGIGYNHYGTKSRQYYERKQANKNENMRGYRTPLDRIDSNNVLSFSALKFLRAVRRRFIGMGVPVSDNVGFVEVAQETCFFESNFAYTATESTQAGNVEGVHTMEECCQACFMVEMCKAFTLSSGVCSLFIGSKTIPGTVLRDNPYQLHANRSWVLRDVSGIPLREGECKAGQ